jgi:hypothetical protein
MANLGGYSLEENTVFVQSLSLDPVSIPRHASFSAEQKFGHGMHIYITPQHVCSWFDQTWV